MIKDIYLDPELYDAAHWWKTNDMEFITNTAITCGGPALEMAAGTGRLALPIIERGINYTGIELSSSFRNFARKKLAKFGDLAQVFEGDMRKFDLDMQYQFIFIGFNSIFHLLNNEDVASFLFSVYNHLLDDGLFLIDAFVPHPIFLYRAKQKYYVMEFDWPSGEHCIVNETNHYDPNSQINHIHWYFNTVGVNETDEYQFDMHMIFPDTMDRLLTEAGFIIKNKYGDYDKKPLGPESHLQIYVCGK